jgi:hypothetical protein
MMPSLSVDSASHLLTWSNGIYVVDAVLTLGIAAIVLYEKHSKSGSFSGRSGHLPHWAFQLIAVAMLLASGPASSSAQVSSGPAKPAVQPPPLPITTQIKKTIAFLESDCLHDFKKDQPNLTRDKIVQMTPAQQVVVLNQLRMLTLRLRLVKPSLDKLSPEEAARLFPNGPPAVVGLNDIPDQIGWQLDGLIKMTTLTDDEIAGLSQKDLDALSGRDPKKGDNEAIPVDSYRGTGFFVAYVDARIKPQPGDAGPRYFRYLVTNRHVAQPGIESGAPCKMISSFILLNHNPDAAHIDTYPEFDRIDKIFKWKTPQDDSVDLATTAIGFDDTLFDQSAISTDQFVTEEEMKNHYIVEGDPVLFAGLFVQTFDEVHTLEPIVRSGTVAMIPRGMLQTTLNKKMGHIYLAEAHAFGGNSGSPIFVDPNRFAGVLSGPFFKLLGVISGEMIENSDLTFSVTTSLSGNIAANSDVSMVVPGAELMKLLDDPDLKADRDRQIEAAEQPR